MGYLPSKNFIALVSSFLVVILTGYFGLKIWNSAPSRPQTTNSQSSISFLAAYKDASRDADSDNLKDWEEILWKTDVNKQDTDGDGAPDGEEVKDGRDPTIAGRKLANGPPAGGWSDAFLELEKARPKTAATPSTLTEKVAGEFAVQYLTALGNASPGGLDNFQQKIISESLIKSVASGIVTFKDTFLPSDIAVESNPSKDFIKNYLNAAGSFLDKNFMELDESEADILDRAINLSDFKELEKLSKYIQSYQRAVDFLKKQKVPSVYVSSHIEMINILNNAAAAVSYMQASDKDPVKGLLGLSIYGKQFSRVPNFIRSIQKQIKSDELNFFKTEGGYHFLRYE
ncbi:MAG: hypothetical protein UW81_C0007G0009 [Candidatus Giovannonibacteria bacterium GW2011_GWC2_44_9]|uniref:Thrombospondin type 3 repeat superfamily protein n=2 Tax=Candidatus Giovannoniibacteriota TaxID=1752738 RepID=A0A0G1IWP6_9BACT|nr:MAG: hypothetical protein UW57_C0006G0017 [Candidatus Giovannonibacteria bacterium GW2011_GWA1_44_29]KKT84014.1 MAG: hypothetical protein UW81_C0007G0009 [Candidatus Giovannonibacteria bacterium GW2011_GWC2_44_9]KKT91278.1 MAG: hypothetical protein UW93_C0009G0009 [Parcubacteria group bacterium GW2011_GWC1_45_13]KKU29801.1 MAG: hypothetical protein UX43_C0005G0009 [Candidatus Giovannonibacteria bacterium GW2011_GWB1_46_20]